MAKNITLRTLLGEALYPKAQNTGIDTSNILFHATGYPELDFTATEDCFAIVYRWSGYLTIDGLQLFDDRAYYCFPLKKGQHIQCDEASGPDTYIFGLKH